MASLIEILKTLGDTTRLRLLALLENHELSVNELQEITHVGQSRISTHLGLMQKLGLVKSRREGKRIFYQASKDLSFNLQPLTHLAAQEIEEHANDRTNLKRILELRKEPALQYFYQIAGRFDRSYGPGRSWQAFGNLLLQLIPPLDVADLGSGEGLISQLLASRCRRVIAVDNSEKIVAYGRERAAKHEIHNLEFRCGDLQTPPIDPETIDLVLFSQALHHAPQPEKALENARKLLKPAGQIIILDLLQHTHDWAKETYGDLWLGFSENQLQTWLEAAGFEKVQINIVAREEEAPHFQTVMATGSKPVHPLHPKSPKPNPKTSSNTPTDPVSPDEAQLSQSDLDRAKTRQSEIQEVIPPGWCP